VNQKGEVQAIGGVNEKIEGFFEVCKKRGLTGDQGVLIPYSNTINLALKKEVVKAVAEGKFHIWAVKTIQEGIEILTGQKAGEVSWDAENEELVFEEGTIFEKVNARLKELGEIAKAARKNGNNSQKDNGQGA
jgi:predicted ATP-dependent protease